jgi:radical SAM superfamily enzyme YgiQ (UPF0313 family)
MRDNKLLLIYPTVHQPGMPRIKPFWLPPLGLASLAGLTPQNWDIRLWDENVEDIDFDTDCDVVAIGCMTANSKRAYEIAAAFRNRGKKVILGGPHVTVCGMEALQYADTIVSGDPEPVWNTVLDDFRNGQLKKIYTVVPDDTNIDQFSFPRRDLFKPGAYLSINSLQTSRGCPHTCSFCSIASRYKRRYGKKSISQVLSEIEMLPDKSQPVFFVDDNIFVDRARSKELLTGIRQFNIHWWSQTDINIMNDKELLTLAKESGCIKLVVGFESLSEGSIGSIDKKQNQVDVYGKFIEVLYDHGILANTSFAFGADSDREDVFEKTLKFLEDHRVIFATFNILTPLPGTKLFTQMDEAGRIIDRDWKHYDMGHPVFQPKNFSMEVLKDGYDWICKEFYGLPRIAQRISLIKSHRDIFDINLIMNWNLGYKKMLDTFGVFM